MAVPPLPVKSKPQSSLSLTPVKKRDPPSVPLITPFWMLILADPVTSIPSPPLAEPSKSAVSRVNAIR